MQKELLTLSRKELDRLSVMKLLQEKRLKQKGAAERLHLCVRQIRRIISRFRRQGPEGLASRKRGRPSNRCLPEGFRQQAMSHVRKSYHDFKPTFAQEKLLECHGIDVSVSTLRKWMIEAGLHTVRRKRRAAFHQLRERRPCFGELVQIDGSHHRWFEERGGICALIVFIDDASGRILFMRFYPAETSEAYMDGMRHYLAKYGRPVSFYSDKDSVFRINREEVKLALGLTQVGRILKTLDIELICANSPQAKGRVERSFQTLQNRLVKELRLAGISSITEANRFLEGYRKRFNRRFAVKPRSPENVHRPVRHSQEELDVIFSFQEPRILSKCLSMQYKNTTYQVMPDGPSLSLRGARVVVCEDSKHDIRILYKGRFLPFTTLAKGGRYTPIADAKTVNALVDMANLSQKKHPLWKPPVDHPWRHMKINCAPFLSSKRTFLRNGKEDIST
jgi:transposase